MNNLMSEDTQHDPDIPILSAETATTDPTRRGPSVLALSFLAVAVLVGGGLFAAQQWLSGTDQSAAEVIPADVEFYVGFDAVKLLSGDVAAIADTITGSLEAIDDSGEIPDAGSMVESLDEMLLGEVGFDFSNDIQPWVGRSMAIAVDGISADITSFDPYVDPDALLVIAVRDAGEADAFIVEHLVDELELTEVAIEDGIAYENADENAMLARVDGRLLAGTVDMVQRAIALDPENSLAQNPDFVRFAEALPEDRILTGYYALDPELLTAEMGLSAEEQELFPEAASAAAWSVSITDGAIAVDSVAQNPWDLESGFMLAADPTFPTQLPDSTVFMMQFGSVSDLYGFYQDVYGDLYEEMMGMTWEEMVVEVESESGIDDIEGLVALLDGDTGVAVSFEDRGGVPVTEDVTIGVLGAAGTSDPSALATRIDEIVALVGADATELERDGSLYRYDDPYEGFEVAGGVVGDWLAVGTGALVDGLTTTPETSLAESERYQDAIARFAGSDMTVIGYVDIAQIVDRFVEDVDTHTAADPYEAVVFGGGVSNDLIRGRVVLVIDVVE